MAPVLTLPDAALEPAQEPLATQDEGLPLALQVIVELAPELMAAGATVMDTTGTAITVSVADFVSLPAELLHASVYVKVPAEFITPVLVLPLPALAPLQEFDAVQEDGLLVALQLSVELLPVPMLFGEMESVTTGAITPPPPATTPTVVVAEVLPAGLAFEHVKV